MISIIAAKELTEFRRDGRALLVFVLLAALIVVGLLTARATHVKHEQEVRRVQAHDQETFLRQGAKPSHSAAHFGRMAYKPPAPLAVFDPGASPYLGQVIWLEAHRQDPAMFRPAEDAPELSRLSDFSVAGILISLLPLLTFVVGAGAFAAERDRGTLRQIVISGARLDAIFRGKLLATAGVGVVIACAVIAASTIVALSSDGSSALDTMTRGALLCAGFAAYACACAGVALFVSAHARSATSALLILLTIWAISVVVAPRVAASVAELRYPTPNGPSFWAQVSELTRAGRPARDSEELRRVEASAISRAIGRDVSEKEIGALKLNRAALGQEVSEVLGARAFAEAYGGLHETYERQQRLRRWASFASPTIALLHWSSTVAGTDLSAHRHFAFEAEHQRQLIVRRMNEDMMLNGAGQGYDYLSSADFWRTVPDFVYRPPSVGSALRSALLDGLLLFMWSALAIWAAAHAARRQRAIQEGTWTCATYCYTSGEPDSQAQQLFSAPRRLHCFWRSQR